MIDQDKRKAIFLLHEAGMSIGEISKKLYVSENTVRDVIAQKGIMPKIQRKDKILISPELVSNLYKICSGRIQRVYEKLNEEEGIEVGYSTLSRIVRQLGLRRSAKGRCQHVPDEPGVEMQHDTSNS